MTSDLSPSPYRHVVGRWLKLACQRLDHLIKMRENGRYSRYYSEEEFRRIIEEARRSVQTWEGLVSANAERGVVINLRRDGDNLRDRAAAQIFQDPSHMQDLRSAA